MTEPEVRIAAGDRGFEERVQRLADRVQAGFRYHSIELPDGSVLPGLQSLDHLRWRFSLFGMPEDLRGKRVLDIGAWDGWFSFECERRGAEVVAVDCIAHNTFIEAKELIGSKVEYLELDVNELSARRLGRFDIVMFLGVLYHLRHPLLGLEKVLELTTDLALVESYVIGREARQIPSVMEFYEGAELGGQVDNWCGPSPECLVGMCRSAGFARVELKDITNQRASVVCHRRWEEPSAVSAAAPQLHAATNNRSYVAVFHPLKDEYICCYFKSDEPDLGKESVFVQVDGYGIQTLVLAGDVNGYQANCLRPPGLEPGLHEVRIRTANSDWSNAVGFTLLDESGKDMATSRTDLPAEAPELCSAELQASGDSRSTAIRGGSLVCYFRSVARLIMPADVSIEIDGATARANTISSLGDGVWQANLLLDRQMSGCATVRLRLGSGPWSRVFEV